MKINVCFDMHASSIECNIDESIFEEAVQKLEDWLYEEKQNNNMRYRGIRDSLNIDILDVNIVIRFFKEVYPNSNPKVIQEKLEVDALESNVPTINL